MSIKKFGDGRSKPKNLIEKVLRKSEKEIGEGLEKDQFREDKEDRGGNKRS